MALRLLGRKLMTVKPQKLRFYFRNSSHTAVVHDNPPSDSDARIRPSVNLVMEYSVRPDQYEDDVLEENRQLKEGNCQLIENFRLKAENRQLIENRRLKEENHQLIERLKTVEEELIGDLQHDTNKPEDLSRKTGEMNKIREMNLMDISKKENLKDDASNTINELFEKVTQLEEKILGALHRNIQNDKSLENKLDEALLKMEEMNKEQHHLSCIVEENLIAKLEIASKTMNDLNQMVLRELEIQTDRFYSDKSRDLAYTKRQAFS